MKVWYGILGAIGVTGILLSLLMTWFTMAPTSDQFYERSIKVAKALDESRIKQLAADKDLQLKELDAARMLDIERDVHRDSIVSDFKNKMASKDRAQNEARIRNTKDRQRKLTIAGFGLLLSLLMTAYSIRGLRAKKLVDSI